MPYPMGNKIGIGSRVRVLGLTMSGIDDDPMEGRFLGAVGVVQDTDDIMHHVLLDNFLKEGPMVFIDSELEEITWTHIAEGGEVKAVYTPITPEYVLSQPKLSVYHKLCYFCVHFNNPADYEQLCDSLGVTMEFARTLIAGLMEKGLVVESKTQKNLFFASYQIAQQAVPPKEKEEATTITEKDKDILLFIKALEKHYNLKGANHKISKNGRKYIAKAVFFLDGMWNHKRIKPEMDEFEVKDDFYLTYIEYVFRNTHKDDLNQLKRLSFSGTKKGFKTFLVKPTYRFDPHLVDKKFDEKHFFGVKKDKIPKDITKSGYWNTYKIFLGSKYADGNYPIAKQVLYALEMVIIFMLFRKQTIGKADSTSLINIHSRYVIQYRTAQATNKLDNLKDYVLSNKMKSDVCNDCVIKGKCVTRKTAAIVVSCSQKRMANESE